MTANVLVSTENLPYEEWLEYRRTGIGGSDAAVVCGISRYKSPVELWMEKTGQLPSQEAGEAAYWGNLLESLVREEFTKRTGISVTKPSALYQSEEHPFMLANVDGLCEDPAHGPCGGNAFRWKFVERDEELIAMLISLEEDFWRHVQNGTPPALDGSNASARFLAERFSNSVPQSEIALPGKAQKLLSQYDEACRQLEESTARKQEAENLLKEMLGDHEIGTTGNRVVTWKSVTQERLDTKTLKAEHPTLFKKYASQTSYRRFAIKTVRSLGG